MIMLRLFAEINAKIWWRSIQGIELAAMIFYSIFILIVAGQFMGLLIILLFTDDIEFAQQFYPWITGDIQYFVHLVFVNVLWINQVFFTKINRFNLNENRKLLTYGFGVNRLSKYLNFAGFLHPLNLLFTFFWLTYSSFLAESALQITASVLLILANYAVLNSIKWRFRIFSVERFKYVSAVVITIVVFFMLIIHYHDYSPYLFSPAVAAESFTPWLIYTPGYVFFYVFAVESNTAILIFIICTLSFLLFLLMKDMIMNTKAALLTPVQQSSHKVKKSKLSNFIYWLGHEGGKYFFTVWSHKYSKIQLLITYVFVIPYIVILGDGIYVIGVFLTLIPVIFLLVMLTNLFGFENRELLLSLQLPVKIEYLVKQRLNAALLITLAGSSIVLILVPVFITDITVMIQVHMGIILISLVFLHYIMKSSIDNYKKIEEVSVMSVSNPVLPASVTFTSVFIVMILGVFTFIVFERFIWYHISVLFVVNIFLYLSLRKKLLSVYEPFKEKVIPKLWNEL
ncbi:MAG: hypothetical protein EA359_04165 [Balneolaceae bacterium]|nr:MAG: hypothetical protein EA359_04165 [Balneolaceae bacterium]